MEGWVRGRRFRGVPGGWSDLGHYRGGGIGSGGRTEVMKASWYWRCSGALRTLCRTLRTAVSAIAV